jgi:hypothetical protein
VAEVVRDERASLFSAVEFAIGALRSNQDTLLHKVPRNEAIRLQLEQNRSAIEQLKEVLAKEGVSVN